MPTEKLAWSDMDGYPSMPIGNLGWGFTVYLLLREGGAPHEAQYYASKYLKAFPEFFQTFPKREHSNVEQRSHSMLLLANLRSFPYLVGICKG